MALTVENSPARRFLERGQQLLRLQDRILKHVQQELQEGRRDVEAMNWRPETMDDLAKIVEFSAADSERSTARWADIGLMLQLFLARYVDNFQSFVDELLRDIYRAKPEILKGSEAAVSMKDVLSHASIEALLETAIERRVRNLGYKSLADLESSIATELDGFRLFPRDKSFIARLFDIRNLITHNYGIVNEWFARRYPEPKLTVGQAYPLGPAEIQRAWATLVAATTDIELRARQKFRLPS